MWMLCEQEERKNRPAMKSISRSATSTLSLVEPYLVKVALGLGCQPMGH